MTQTSWNYYYKIDGQRLLTLSVPFPDKDKKLTLIFIFTLLFGAAKGFMKAPQRRVKIKIWVNFYFTTAFWNARDGK